MLIHLEIVQQLLPSLRLDGYFILADLIGVPDLFRRIGPTLRSLVPGRSADPELRKLKRSARISLTIWVLIVVPMLFLQLGFVILDGPYLVRSFVSSLSAQLQALTTEVAHTEIAAGLLTVISTVLLILPMAGLSYIVLRTAHGAFRQVLTATRRRPWLRLPAVATTVLLAAALALHWGILPVKIHLGHEAAGRVHPALSATTKPSPLTDAPARRPTRRQTQYQAVRAPAGGCPGPGERRRIRPAGEPGPGSRRRGERNRAAGHRREPGHRLAYPGPTSAIPPSAG